MCVCVFVRVCIHAYVCLTRRGAETAAQTHTGYS